MVRLLRIRPEDIGVTVCGGKVGKTGIHAYATSLTFGASCGIKVHSVKYQDTFVDTLYIQTPAKNSKVQKRVYMTPFLPIEDIDHEIIDPLLATDRTSAVWSTLLHSSISLSSDECATLVKSIDLVVEAKADYITPKKPKKEKAILQYSSIVTSQFVDPTVEFDTLLNSSNLPSFFQRVCSMVDLLQQATLRLKTNSLPFQKNHEVSNDTFGGELLMLEDKLGSNPNFTDVHLRTALEGINFVYSALLDSINNGTSSSSQHEEVQRLLSPFLSSLAACNSKLTNLESIIVSTLP